MLISLNNFYFLFFKTFKSVLKDKYYIYKKIIYIYIKKTFYINIYFKFVLVIFFVEFICLFKSGEFWCKMGVWARLFASHCTFGG